MSGCYGPKTQYKPIIRTLFAICQDAMAHRTSIAHYTDAICHMSGCYGPQNQFKPIIRMLYAICQDAMSQRPSISPLYGRYLSYVRMVWPKDTVQAHYTDAICHIFGCYVPQTQYKPIIRTLYAICQDGMSHRPSISPLYGRFTPYVRMLCPRDPL